MYSSNIRKEAKRIIESDQFNFYLVTVIATLSYYFISKLLNGVMFGKSLTVIVLALSIMAPEVIYYSAINKGTPIEYERDFEEVLRGDYVRYIITAVLRQLYIMLWSLLLVIPGIIKQYSYALVPYILADNPGMKSNEAIQESNYLMKGNKARLFQITIYYDLLLVAGMLMVFLINAASTIFALNLIIVPRIFHYFSRLIILATLIGLQLLRIYILPYKKISTIVFYKDLTKDRYRRTVNDAEIVDEEVIVGGSFDSEPIPIANRPNNDKKEHAQKEQSDNGKVKSSEDYSEMDFLKDEYTEI